MSSWESLAVTRGLEHPSYLLEATLVSLLILGPAICIGIVADARWGSIAEWVAALATLAAFIAAVIAARFAARALAIEQDREADRQEGEKRAQAALVSAWIEVEYEVRGDGSRAAVKGLTCLLRNASAVPVHDVKVIGLLDRRTKEARTREVFRDVELSTLPPSADPVVKEIGGPGPGGLVAFVDSAARSARIAARCTMEFTDSSGRRWVRWPDGQLDLDPDYEGWRVGGA
jgi:hypothetical protein